MLEMLDTRSFFVGLGVDDEAVLDQLVQSFESVSSRDLLLVTLRDRIRYGCYCQPSDLLRDIVQLVPGACCDPDMFFALAELREFREVSTRDALDSILPMYQKYSPYEPDMNKILFGLGGLVPEWLMPAIVILAERVKRNINDDYGWSVAQREEFVGLLTKLFERFNLIRLQSLTAQEVARAFEAGFPFLYPGFSEGKRDVGKLPKWLVPELRS